jgi:peptidyl-prolyl cis-trans isomerase D
MFEFFRKHTWLLQVVLAFVVVAFVGTSVYQGYGRLKGDEEATIAHIDGRKLTRSEWSSPSASRSTASGARCPTVDAKLFDTPEMKRQSLDLLVRERVSLVAADKLTCRSRTSGCSAS